MTTLPEDFSTTKETIRKVNAFLQTNREKSEQTGLWNTEFVRKVRQLNKHFLQINSKIDITRYIEGDVIAFAWQCMLVGKSDEFRALTVAGSELVTEMEKR